jgi:hypothetical protein
MRHHICFLMLLIVVVSSVAGQTKRPAFERGKIEELKGLNTVWVSSFGRDKSQDKSLAKKVTLTIQKELPGLTFVDSPIGAEIWIFVYEGTKSESTRIPPNLNTPPNLNIPQSAHGDWQARLSYEQVLAVRGSVTIQRSGTRRLIIDFSKSGGGKNRMAEQFAKEFIRAYQKAMANP